jgi:sulfofructose kinase
VKERIDVLGLGAVAVDDLLFLSEYPAPDSKHQILGTERHAGGLAGTALVAASRLGCACAYAGTLGSDELSRFIIDGFQAEGVSVRHLVHRDGAPPFHSIILVDTRSKTRTILFNAAGVVGPSPSEPSEEVIRSARVLLVDHVGLEGMVRAARIARRAGIPVVADLERNVGGLFADLLAAVDHLILPYEFARGLSGASDGPSTVRALWADDRAAVVVTLGDQGSWYLTSEEPGKVFHQPAFRVEVVDTNGCGDVFHGAYAVGLSEGMHAAERMRFAAGVAACKATRVGGQKGIPSRAEAMKFLESRSAEAARAPA